MLVLTLVVLALISSAEEDICSQGTGSVSPLEITAFRNVSGLRSPFARRFTADTLTHLWISAVPRDGESDPDIKIYALSDASGCLTVAYSGDFGGDVVSVPVKSLRDVSIKYFFVSVNCVSSATCYFDVIFSPESVEPQPLTAGVTTSGTVYPGVPYIYTFDCVGQDCTAAARATILVYPSDGVSRAALNVKIRKCPISSCADSDPVGLETAWFAGHSASIDRTEGLVNSRITITVACASRTATAFAILLRFPESVELIDTNRPYLGVTEPGMYSRYNFSVITGNPDLQVYLRSLAGHCRLNLSSSTSQFKSDTGQIEVLGAQAGVWSLAVGGSDSTCTFSLLIIINKVGQAGGEWQQVFMGKSAVVTAPADILYFHFGPGDNFELDMQKIGASQISVCIAACNADVHSCPVSPPTNCLTPVTPRAFSSIKVSAVQGRWYALFIRGSGSSSLTLRAGDGGESLITEGEDVRGFAAPGQTVHFHFEAVAGGIYKFSLTPISGDPTATLTALDGLRIIGYKGDTYATAFTVIAGATVGITVTADHFHSYFSLRVFNATPTNLTAGFQSVGVLTRDAPADYYSVDPTAGESLALTVLAGSDCRAEMSMGDIVSSAGVLVIGKTRGVVKVFMVGCSRSELQYSLMQTSSGESAIAADGGTVTVVLDKPQVYRVNIPALNEAVMSRSETSVPSVNVNIRMRSGTATMAVGFDKSSLPPPQAAGSVYINETQVNNACDVSRMHSLTGCSLFISLASASPALLELSVHLHSGEVRQLFPCETVTAQIDYSSPALFWATASGKSSLHVSVISGRPVITSSPGIPLHKLTELVNRPADLAALVKSTGSITTSPIVEIDACVDCAVVIVTEAATEAQVSLQLTTESAMPVHLMDGVVRIFMIKAGVTAGPLSFTARPDHLVAVTVDFNPELCSPLITVTPPSGPQRLKQFRSPGEWRISPVASEHLFVSWLLTVTAAEPWYCEVSMSVTSIMGSVKVIEDRATVLVIPVNSTRHVLFTPTGANPLLRISSHSTITVLFGRAMVNHDPAIPGLWVYELRSPVINQGHSVNVSISSLHATVVKIVGGVDGGIIPLSSGGLMAADQVWVTPVKPGLFSFVIPEHRSAPIIVRAKSSTPVKLCINSHTCTNKGVVAYDPVTAGSVSLIIEVTSTTSTLVTISVSAVPSGYEPIFFERGRFSVPVVPAAGESLFAFYAPVAPFGVRLLLSGEERMQFVSGDTFGSHDGHGGIILKGSTVGVFKLIVRNLAPSDVSGMTIELTDASQGLALREEISFLSVNAQTDAVLIAKQDGYVNIEKCSGSIKSSLNGKKVRKGDEITISSAQEGSGLVWLSGEPALNVNREIRIVSTSPLTISWDDSGLDPGSVLYEVYLSDADNNTNGDGMDTACGLNQGSKMSISRSGATRGNLRMRVISIPRGQRSGERWVNVVAHSSSSKYSLTYHARRFTVDEMKGAAVQENVNQVSQAYTPTIILILFAVLAVIWASVMSIVKRSNMHFASALDRNPYRAPQAATYGADEELLLRE